MSLPQVAVGRRLVVTNLVTLFSGSAIAQGVTFLALFLTARQLGASQYGQYAACFVITGFASIAFSLGMDIWLLREGSGGAAQLRKSLGTVLAIKGGFGIIWLAVVALAASLVNSSVFPVSLVCLSALCVWLDSLLATILTGFKASFRNEITSTLESGTDLVWLLGTLLLLRLGERETTTYLAMRAAALGLGVGIGVGLVLREIRIQASLEVARRIMRSVLPFASSELLAWAYMRVDVLIVALVLGETATGLYSPAVGMTNALFLAPAAVYAVAVPLFSQLLASDVGRAWRAAKQILLLVAAIGTLLSGGIFVFAAPLTSWLGASFNGMREILQTLSPIALLHSLSFGMAAILVAGNQQAGRAIVQAIAVLASIILNLLVARWAGVRGVAVVYVTTEAILLIGYAWLVLRYRLRSIAQGPRGEQSECPSTS